MTGILALLALTSYTGATLIDGNGNQPIANATIVTDGTQILYAGPADKAPKTSTTVDCKGKWIIPGLWDMHTHIDDPELIEVKPTKAEKAQWLPLFILNGVTSAREMAGDVDLLKEFKTRIHKGDLLGPRLWFGGPLVDGPQPMWPESIAVDSPEKARQVVRDLKAKGADFVKAYSLLPRDAFFALCDEAKNQNIPVCGHVPTQVKNEEACEAGLNSIEHLLQLDRELADPDKVTELRAAMPAGLSREQQFLARTEIFEKAYSPYRAADLFAKFKAKGVWIDPTLVVAYQNSTFDAGDKEMTRRRQYIPAYVREWWDPNLNVHLKGKSAEISKGQQTTFRIYKRIVADLKKAGVPMMTGSDMGGNPHCFAGWGVHDELAFLVDAGLTPMEAIVAGTSNPAKYLKVFDRHGSLETGKTADFVILDADPLTEIRNTSKIQAVVYDGKHWDRKGLDHALEVQKKEVAKRDISTRR